MMRNLLSNRFRLATFIISCAFALALFAIVSGTILLTPLELNPTIEPIRLGLMVLISLATGLVLTSFLVSKANPSNFAGSVLGFFTTACAYCVPLWIYALGLGGAFGFLSDLSPLVAAISLALLSYSLWNIFDPECKVIQHGKSIQNQGDALR
ncbi:hypothetical protein HY989_05475 [Candidatus Micrarchaeota archaeon]|nr:hypothetical protein [Candidatus Micrarchaeota archaeon]